LTDRSMPATSTPCGGDAAVSVVEVWAAAGWIGASVSATAVGSRLRHVQNRNIKILVVSVDEGQT
jgi:hypothetical protein